MDDEEHILFCLMTELLQISSNTTLLQISMQCCSRTLLCNILELSRNKGRAKGILTGHARAGLEQRLRLRMAFFFKLGD